MPAKARPMSAANPMMWATGSAMTASSRWRRVGHIAALEIWPTRALCVSAAPFGEPVVPDV